MSVSVAVFSAKPYDQRFLQAAVPDSLSLSFYDMPLNHVSALMAADSPIVSAFVNDEIDAKTLQILAENGTRLLALRCAGTNQVDLTAAKTFGIRVVNVPAYSPYAVAEHTIALMLALSRHLPRAYNRVRDGNFSLDGLLGFDFHGKQAGVIGGGHIGELVAHRLKAFGCEVKVYDPYQQQALNDAGLATADLDTVLQESSIISLHCPLTEETRHLIDAIAIQKMRPGVMLINTSRGALLDTAAVLEAIKSHQIGYLGIDVYEQEGSLFFEDHSADIIQDDVFQRLLMFPNVMVTGHQGYFTREALQHITDTTFESIDDFLHQRPLKHQVV